MHSIEHPGRHLTALTVAAALGAVLPLTIPVAAHADTPLPPNCTNTSNAGFAGASDLTLNQRAAVVVSGDGSVLRVTNATFPGGAGSAFTTNKVALQDAGSFSTAFSFRTSDQRNGGADGLVFTVQNVANNVGAAGGAMGYGGLSQSIGVEFDDWYNPPGDFTPTGDPLKEPDGNHAGIDVNGNMQSDPVASLTPLGINLDAGAVEHAWVDYNGATDQLEVRVADSTTRPATALLTKTVDLPAILGGTGSPAQDAFVGFSAGTGFGAANFDILNWSYKNCYQPDGVDASPVVDAGGPYAGHRDQAVPLAGTVADDNPGVTRQWSLSGGPAGSSCFIDSPTSPTATVRCDAVGNYTLTLTGTDSIGQTASDTATLTVSNQAPVAAALDLIATNACAVSATLHFTDPDVADTHTVSFAWGDTATSAGTVTESTGTGTGSHTYAHAGTYTVSATVSDGQDTATTSRAYATKNTAGAFLPPINAAGTRSSFRLGSTIPI